MYINNTHTASCFQLLTTVLFSATLKCVTLSLSNTGDPVSTGLIAPHISHLKASCYLWANCLDAACPQRQIHRWFASPSL